MSYQAHSFAGAKPYGTSPYHSKEVVEDRVRRFLPMVRRAAWHIYGVGREGLDVEDLMQAGVVALTEAATRHNGPGEDGFAAYAKMRVRGAMFDQIRRLMPDSRTTVQRRKQYEAVCDELRGLHGREPSRAEIAERLGCSDAELAELETARTQLTTIEDSYDETHPAFADEAPDPFEILAEMEDRERILHAVQQLPERLQLVLQLFFVEEMNLTEISEVLEVSVPRVHQLRGQALSKLKALMTAD
ncbi:sigma-70 family RNA polymerase sigma factor [Altererythrobacter sp. GH1-8]|uniref:sigma-70 family RNA polymerase sigma factor n=1 Tax=Altererythrobacter sp. GH1-8 TaxID=3349333 RepID=UPI00374CB70F